MSDKVGGDLHRVFFALWPGTELRAQLGRLASVVAADGRSVMPAHLHLTLAFPGAVPASVAHDLMARADGMALPAIRLRLDRLGHFPRRRLVWLAPSETPEPLAALAAGLHRLCREAGVAIEERPFRPHVTLRRHVTRFEPAPVQPLDWKVREMVLIESGSGGVPGAYRLLRHWQFPDAAT